MAERFHEVHDAEGNIVCRVVYNPQQVGRDVPWWLEVSEGYTVYKGKQACHDRQDEPKRKAVPK